MSEIDSEYLKKNEPFRKIRLIGGAYAMVDTPSLVGYCHNKGHKGFITVTIMNEHDCIAKGCYYFEKFEDYPYWQRQARREEAKAIEREKVQRQKEIHQQNTENAKKRDEAFIEKAYRIAEELGKRNFKITSIRKEKNIFTIFYVSDKDKNDWYNFQEIIPEMNSYFNKRFRLKHVKMPDGSYATIQDVRK